jgi:hypothetical protein
MRQPNEKQNKYIYIYIYNKPDNIANDDDDDDNNYNNDKNNKHNQDYDVA